MWAARAWAAGGAGLLADGPEPEVIADARQAGMDDASLERLRADLGDEDGLWPDHVAVLEAFLLCDTQWRVVPVTGPDFVTRIRYVGLDYAGCRAALALGGVAVTPGLFAALQVMELAAAAAHNSMAALP